MPRLVKRVADMIQKDRTEKHSWLLRDVRGFEDRIARFYSCHCGAVQTRVTMQGDDTSRRVYYRVGGGGHG